ncbi:MAG: AmmeMemoRadiSam system protein B [Candidatus Margulisiibacteriota bacterium]
MAIVFGAIAPHPPILVPDIGGKNISQIKSTKTAMEKLAEDLTAQAVDTIIVFTPHGLVSQVSFPIYAAHVFEGSFVEFGRPKTRYSYKGDSALAMQIIKECRFANVLASQVSENLLDHGLMVPLHYLNAALKKPILPIAIAFRPLKELFAFGQLLAKVCEASGKKIAVIASADMSHRLTQAAPAGFHPRGKEFDAALVALVKKNDVAGILDFDPELADAAGQDALWSIAMLLGALDGKDFRPQVLSYEGPFGVGYMVAEYEK